MFLQLQEQRSTSGRRSRAALAPMSFCGDWRLRCDRQSCWWWLLRRENVEHIRQAWGQKGISFDSTETILSKSVVYCRPVMEHHYTMTRISSCYGHRIRSQPACSAT